MCNKSLEVEIWAKITQSWAKEATSLQHTLTHTCVQLWYLIAHVYRGVSSQQQRHDVHVAFLRREVQRGDALARHGVGGGAVLQEGGGDLHLVLLRCNVEGRVTVLGPEKQKRGESRYRAIYFISRNII